MGQDEDFVATARQINMDMMEAILGSPASMIQTVASNVTTASNVQPPTDVRDLLTAEALLDIRQQADREAVAAMRILAEPDPTNALAQLLIQGSTNVIRQTLRESGFLRSILPMDPVDPPSFEQMDLRPLPAKKAVPVLHDTEEVERVMEV
jgi:hypothetical protein